MKEEYVVIKKSIAMDLIGYISDDMMKPLTPILEDAFDAGEERGRNTDKVNLNVTTEEYIENFTL